MERSWKKRKRGGRARIGGGSERNPRVRPAFLPSTGGGGGAVRKKKDLQGMSIKQGMKEEEGLPGEPRARPYERTLSDFLIEVCEQAPCRYQKGKGGREEGVVTRLPKPPSKEKAPDCNP